MIVEPQAVAVSPYDWLMTHYGWLAGKPWFLWRRRKLWWLTAAWRIIYIISYSHMLATPLTQLFCNIYRVTLCCRAL